MIVAELWKIANEVTNPKSEQNWKLNLDGEIVSYLFIWIDSKSIVWDSSCIIVARKSL